MSHLPKLLVCIPDFPFPARKNGISIRYYPILEHASKSFDIHLVAISNSALSIDEVNLAKVFCKRISIFTRTPKKVGLVKKCFIRLRALIPYQTPFDYVHYDEKEIAEFLKNETADTEYAVALNVLVTHQKLVGRYVVAKRHVLDVIDSPYSTKLRTQRPGLVSRYESWLVRKWEQNSVSSCDYACYISPLDKLLALGNAVNKKVDVIPNGLFLQDHSDERLDFDCVTVGYLGHMSYPPNVRAAKRLYEIFTLAKGSLPNVKLIIIGRSPAPEIEALAQDPNVVVTGTVENIWPYINGIDLFVFPMEIGSGQQNKLLEAMVAGVPVVSTDLGNSGIGAMHNNQIFIANSNEEIASSVIDLLKREKKRQEIGAAGRKFVTEHYSWPSILKHIDRTLLQIDTTIS